MDTHRCLKVADRINNLLWHELQQGIDIERMVEEPLYARDVLLVCDAHAGTDLAALAQHFRAAAVAVEPPPEKPRRKRKGAALASGFMNSIHSIFGPTSSLPPEVDAAARPKPRPWFSRSPGIGK